jgi:hypothetical protein
MRFDILKRESGGPSRAKVLRALKRNGFPAKPGKSNFRYHTAVVIERPLSIPERRRVRVIIWPDAFTAPGIRHGRARGGRRS